MGSTTILLHAPQDREIDSVKEVWDLATEPGVLQFLLPYLLVSLMQHLFISSFHT